MIVHRPPLGTAADVPIGRLPAILVVPGTIVTLNLCALVAALPVITSAASLVALQASLHAWRDEEEHRLASRFVRELRRQLPRLLPLGLILTLGLFCFVGSVGFWLGTRSPIGLLALAIELPVALSVLAWLLASLEVAATRPAERPTEWAVRSARILLSRPGRAGAAMAGLVGWVFLLDRIPLLMLVAGLVGPALLARWAFHRRPSDGDAGDGGERA